MPRKDDKETGKPDGAAKGSRWDTDDWKTLRGLVLYFVNSTWAQNVYDAVFTKLKFRVIVDNKTVGGIPKANPGVHDATHTVLWGNNDVEWDDAGCLIIKDKQLGVRVVEAHDNGALEISTPGPSGPIGENKVNAMCPC